MSGIKSVCPGCDAELVTDNPGLDGRYNASRACVGLFHELMVFTLTPQTYDFTHQILVDAYTAQHYRPDMKPVTITFALVGLYLVFERGYTGREAELAHMELGKKRRDWPRFSAPRAKAALTVQDVIRAGTENYREMIMKWGRSVWDVWSMEHGKVAGLVAGYFKI